MTYLNNPSHDAVLGSAPGASALDELERSIAHTILLWQPGQKPPVLSQQRTDLVSLRHDSLHGLLPLSTHDDFDMSVGSREPGRPIDEALKKTSQAHLQALSQSGLPLSALSLLQSWMELTVDARVLQQQLELERVFNKLRPSPAMTDAPVAAPDPVEPLSATELGQALGGLTDETVRHREKAGALFSILRPGRKRGREYPAFQAWPGIEGAPLKQVLAKLGAPAALVGADAYGFCTSGTDLLGGLTPVEVLTGSLTKGRELDKPAKGLLGSSAEDRLAAVLNAAEAFAAQVSA